MTPPSVSNVPEGEDPITYGIPLTPSGAIGTVTFNCFGVMMTANITYTKATGTVTSRDGGTVLDTARLVNGGAALLDLFLLLPFLLFRHKRQRKAAAQG